jgi:hypothetical protein
MKFCMLNPFISIHHNWGSIKAVISIRSIYKAVKLKCSKKLFGWWWEVIVSISWTKKYSCVWSAPTKLWEQHIKVKCSEISAHFTHPQGLPQGYKAFPPSATSTDYNIGRCQPEGKFEVWDTQSMKSFTLINPLAPINWADWLSPHSHVCLCNKQWWWAQSSLALDYRCQLEMDRCSLHYWGAPRWSYWHKEIKQGSDTECHKETGKHL